MKVNTNRYVGDIRDEVEIKLSDGTECHECMLKPN